MAWREIYTQSRVKLGITARVKDDYYRVMAEAVKTLVNADQNVKDALLTWLNPYAFNKYKNAQTYRYAAILPATFIQWLSEQKQKTISFSDLKPPNITPEDVIFFAQEYTPTKSVAVQELVKSYMIQFGKFLVSGRYKQITKYPFGDLKSEMPESVRTIVYNEGMLDEFYNVILFGAKPHTTLYFRFLIQTGLRPYHAFFLTCGDIEVDKPQKDAFNRTFYPIPIKNVVLREKRKIREEIKKKRPPEYVYISESLKNDIVKYCEENKITGNAPVFGQYVLLDAMRAFIERRRKSPAIAPRLKYKVKYLLYGLRHTWTSILWAMTTNVGDLIDLGGWGTAGIPLETYRVSMKACEALNIVEKWEIYIPPDSSDKVLEIKARCVRKEGGQVPGAPSVTTEDIDAIKSLIQTLQKQLADETAKREELEKKYRR